MKYPKCESYKDSGIDWLGQVPKGWTIKQLRYSLEGITNGTTTTQIEEEDGAIPVTRIETISEGVINWNKTGWIPYSISEKKYKLQKGDILFSHINSLNIIGNVAQYLDDRELYGGMNLLRIRPLSNLSYRFIYYFLKSKNARNTFSAFAKPAINQASLPTSTLKAFQIVLPDSLQEQQSIANFLDKETTRFDLLIAKKQQLIETLKEKRIAVISQAVTKGLTPDVPMKDSGIEWLGDVPAHWEVKKLKFTVKLINRKVETVEDTDDSNTKYVGLENVIPFKGQITFNGDSYTPEGISNSFNIGDVLFGKLRPYLAKAFVADINGICSSELLVFRPNSILSNEFLLLLVLSDGFLKLVNSSTYGSKMPRASWDFIGNIPITLPKIDEQLEIVQKTKEELFLIDSILTKTEEAINKLQEYKTALISAAVTGKIKVPERA